MFGLVSWWLVACFFRGFLSLRDALIPPWRSQCFMFTCWDTDGLLESRNGWGKGKELESCPGLMLMLSVSRG